MPSLSELVPFVAVAFQAWLFFSIESWELRLALAAVTGYQVWQRASGANRQQKQR